MSKITLKKTKKKIVNHKFQNPHALPKAKAHILGLSKVDKRTDSQRDASLSERAKPGHLKRVWHKLISESANLLYKVQGVVTVKCYAKGCSEGKSVVFYVQKKIKAINNL